MKKTNKGTLQEIQVWLGVIGAAGVIISGNWFSAALLGEPVLKNLFPPYAENPIFEISVTFLLFAFFFWLVFTYRHAFLSARSFRYQPCKQRACLILLLTLPNQNIRPPAGNLPWTLTGRDKTTGGQITKTIEGKSLFEDTEQLTPLNWNWQQLLRALIPHLNHLKEVRLIGSPDTNDKNGNVVHGSKAYAENAKTLIKTYFPKVEVIITPDAVNFEDFNALKNEMNDIIKDSKNKFSEDEIIIDVTGGQKTASIAAATVTLNSQMHFQYVRTLEFGTVPLNEDVMSYDVRVFSPLSEGG